MNYAVILLTLGLACASAAEAQDGSWKVTTRVHLRNGNCVEGDLLRETPKGWVLRMMAGEILVRRDQVDHVETLRIRSLEEPAPKPAPSAIQGTVPLSAVTRLCEPVRSPQPAPRDSTSRRTEFLRLVRLGGNGSAAQVVRSLETLDDDDLDQVTAALCEQKDRTALQEARNLLDHPRAVVRASAVRLVTALGGSARWVDLQERIEDPDPWVRRCALQAMGVLGDTHSFAIIGPRLSDLDAAVRADARAALFSLAREHDGGEDLVRLFLERIVWTEGDATAEILAALGTCGKKVDWQPVARYLSDPAAAVRAQAALALSRIEAPEAAELLLERLEVERDYWPRVQLAGAVQALKLKKAVDPLLTWMEDEDQNIRMAAVRALRQITGQSFGMDRDKWVAWWENARPRD